MGEKNSETFIHPLYILDINRFCFTMLFTYCVFLVVINCGLHPLLYILEAIHSCLSDLAVVALWARLCRTNWAEVEYKSV
jgi:hypothetical protein